MQPNLEKISETIQQFFGCASRKIDIARRTKFVQRRVRVDRMCTFLLLPSSSVFWKSENMTLSSLAQSCLDVGVEITEQGLDRRINAGSQAFLEEMWTLSLEHFRQTEPLAIKLLNQFSGVYLVDSSQISLPANMSELFPGSGGNASTASMKVQLVFDYLRGQFKQLELTHGRAPDQGYRGHWNVLEKDALYIMDLGYYVLETFRAISAIGAYFLSRLQVQTALIDQEGERIALADLLANQCEPVAEYDVRIGSRPCHHIPCRLIAILSFSRSGRPTEAESQGQCSSPWQNSLQGMSETL